MMDVRIATLEQINDLPWGISSEGLESLLGLADQVLENYTGEVEMLYEDSFYRFYQDRLVEATFPDVHQFHVDGVSVLSMFTSSLSPARLCCIGLTPSPSLGRCSRSSP